MKILLLWIAGIILFSCASTQKQQKVHNDIPACVNELIKKFLSEEKTNPPKSIYQYMYNGDTVYFVPAHCCDFFSDLYDSNCNIIAHPDGGITGNGDGRARDFFEKRTDEKLIWKDER